MRTSGLLVSVLLLAGCSGSYSDLEAEYAQEADNAPAVANGFVVTSQKHDGLERFESLASVRPSPGRIDLSPSLFWRRSVSIPATDVAYCSMTCAGPADSRVDLLVPRTGSRITIRNPQAVLDWCWTHRIPILPSADTRNWLDNGAPLPPPSTYAAQFDDRRVFDQQAHQGCPGN